MQSDLANLLREWPFDHQNNIRVISDAHGRQKVQIRVDQGAFQGLLQMELDGRPDGQRPHEYDFALDFFKAQWRSSLERGEGDRYQLDHQACEELFDESRRVYERYAFLLQIADYHRVIRDTRRNMELFRFVHRHAEGTEDRVNLERWWPYVLRINGVARAMLATQRHDVPAALEILQRTKERILNLKEVPAEEFHAERQRSLEGLDELVEQLTEKRPQRLKDRLERELAEAVNREEYERAAALRDRLRRLEIPESADTLASGEDVLV